MDCVKLTNNRKEVRSVKQSSLVNLVTTYCDHTGKSPATVGTYSVRDGKLFARLDGGASITLHRAEKVIQWLSNNWPSDLKWPSDITRPTPTKQTRAKRNAA